MVQLDSMQTLAIVRWLIAIGTIATPLGLSLSAVEPEFRAGAATVDITPTTAQPSIIAGGFLEAQSSKINDPLYVRSIVLDDGTTQLVLTVVDTCMMTQMLIDDAKTQASRECGIAVDHMMVSATHTHSAPAAMACLGTRQDKAYAAALPAKIAASILAAHKNLQPAKIGWGQIDDWEHTHNRRWIRKPERMIVDPFGAATGRAHMHPGHLSPDVIGPSGPVDPSLSVISLRTKDDRPLALFANYSQHYFGSPAISADYYGAFCKHMASILGESGEGNGPFVCAISQGTSGDLMWMDYGSPAEAISMSSYAESVARYAEKALAEIEYRDSVPLGIVEKTLQLKYRVPDTDRLDWAKPIAEKIENELPKSVTEVYALEAMILHERQQTELKVQALRIGELTIATLPNEVYALTGLKLRGRSPSTAHFNIELANGAEGYIPPPEQHVLGGYTTWPARTAGLEVTAETKIVSALVDGLEMVTGKPRREMTDEHGPYATAILNSKPVAYWRLNDADGQVARSAVNNGIPAQLRDGFAWHLPGVGSGSGIGAEERLSLSEFSGPGQINRAVHLAGGSLFVDDLKLGDTYSFAYWFWLGERSGASERVGTLSSGGTDDEVVAKQFADHQVLIEANGVAAKEKLRADEWNFAAVVRSDKELKVYLNGSAEPAIVAAVASRAAKQRIEFGEDMQGKLDEIAVFDRALTVSEIAAFWNKSGIDEQRALALVERARQEGERLARVQPPKFPTEYFGRIEALKPMCALRLNSPPATLVTTGNVAFNEAAFATFNAGRLAGKSAPMLDNYTVAMWFRNELPNDARPVTAYLFSRGPDGDATAPGDHLGIGGSYRSDLTGRLMVFNGNARDQVIAGRTLISPQTWNHMVLVREGERVRVFLNGRIEPEIDAVLDVTAAESQSYFVGARCDQFAPLQGNIAYFSLFSRAFSNDQAKELYTASGQPVGAPSAPVANLRPLQPASEPLEPLQSLAKVHVPPGFRVELVAAEPQVIDPVAFDWDSAGRLWVVEMSDYPLGMDGAGKAGGRIRVLEDSNRDGNYEKSHLFADGLNFPNGIMVWRDGVLITAAPQLLFLRDTDGDGQADVREVLLDGFNEGNQQLRMNHLRWGIDNWVYCANGGHHANHGLGTKVVSSRNGQAYEIGSRDFRFRPDTGDLELESGPSQFGRNRDAWGHWFGTQNANPLWHYVLPDRYLARNPYVPTATAIQHVVGPNSPAVYPASPPEKRFHSFEQSGRFTSACSSMIYGDTRLFGSSPSYHTFTCEPFHNLVQHNLINDAGVSFTSTRPVGEGPFDFFASEDRWCRPVMVRTGPDGALWVADMYRYMIEHPDWLPQEGKAELLPHYRLGDDRGRIYRVVKENAPAVQELNLESANEETLLATLDSANDWRRDRAHQLLVWNSERVSKNAISALADKARGAKLPQTRAQALYVLEGLGKLPSDSLAAALRDSHPRVREVAVKLAERHRESTLIEAATKLATDSDAKVCLQLALSAGEWSDPLAAEALVVLAKRFPSDPFINSAIMSSAISHAQALLVGLSVGNKEALTALRGPLLRLAVGRGDQETIAILLANALQSHSALRGGEVDNYLEELQSLQVDLYQMAADSAEGPVAKLIVRLNSEFDAAEATIARESSTHDERLLAAQLMTRVPKYRLAGARALAGLLRPQIDLQLQASAIHALAQTGISEVPALFAEKWPAMSPDLRNQVLEAWLSREAWTMDLLQRLEKREITAGSLSLTQRSRLTEHPVAAIQKIAARVFDEAGKSTRAQILARYHPALALTGVAERGEPVFVRACANCHRRGELGHEVGPNLATVVTHSPEKLLANILDPNVDIQPGYQSYSCLLESGEILVGLLAAETANSVTIKQADRVTRSIARNEIERLQNSNVSFMPEGLEANVSIEEMADLLAFLRLPIADVQGSK